MEGGRLSFRSKFILVTCLYLCCSAYTNAQIREPGALKAGIGITGFSQEKVSTPTILLAYEKDFYPRTLIEVSTEYALPTNADSETITCELSNYRFGMNFLFKALEESNQTFSAGLGFSAGLYQTEKIEISTLQKEVQSDFKPGFSAIIEYDFILPSNWFFGARASTFRYDADRSGWMIMGLFGLRF